MRSRRLTARTIRERRWFVLYLERAFGTATSLDVKTLRMFLADLADTKAATTQFDYHVMLRMWHRWLVGSGERDDDPTALLGTPRLPRSVPRPADTRHIDLVLTHGNLRIQTVMKVLLTSRQGMRVSEVARVRGEEVDLVAERIRILGKGGTDVTADLDPFVAALARAMPDRFPPRGWWFPSPVKPGEHVLGASVSRVLSQAFRRVDAPVTGHMLRHWLATELINEGVPTRVVQDIMRHSSIKTTEGYTKVADASTKGAFRRLPPPAIPPTDSD